MIQILKLHIEEFRGIRKLDIDMGAKSFVVYGPNGSGKSGVVDAIDFALTGSIARLSGAGTGGLTVREHAPHVHKRNDPAAALVALTFRDTVSGQEGTVTRSVKNPPAFTLTPETPELKATLKAAQEHPELTLSRREIIKFILSEAGKRATEVQALLQLHSLDSHRKALKSAQGKCGKDKNARAATLESARGAMARHLDVPQLVASQILGAINPKREILGLAALNEVTFETSFAEGIDDVPAEAPFNKSSALRDLAYFETWLSDTAGLEGVASELLEAIRDLGDDASALETLNHRSFLSDGLSRLVGTATCPLCDTEWASPEALRAHITEKIVLSEAAAGLERAVKTRAAALSAVLHSGRDACRYAIDLTAAWGTSEAKSAATAFSDTLLGLENSLREVPTTIELRERLEAGLLPISPALAHGLETLRAAIETKPDTSAKAQARDYLVLAAERWTQLGIARRASDQATSAHDLATQVYNMYCTSADEALAALYDEVEGRFSEFYRHINSDDEADFKAELEPSSGKLDLLVDFYGLGMFPPGAYHSEGHQDGMGVCLYLALVEKLLGPAFRFAVLDDVVMSVDSNHRKQFCDLLLKQFPEVQFVITTHDPIWAKQMQSSHLISRRAQMHFKGWTVDAGPASEQGQDFWDKIAVDLANDDVPAAAHKLRRGLEAELPDLVEDLQGSVVFRGDAKYELGDMLNAVKGRHKQLLAKAANSASSWNLASEKAKVDELKAARDSAMFAQQDEDWAVNVMVHYNEWATLSKADFQPVVSAWRDFLQLFRCSNEECEGWVAVLGFPGQETALRCQCGQYNLNLTSKPKL